MMVVCKKCGGVLPNPDLCICPPKKRLNDGDKRAEESQEGDVGVQEGQIA